MKKLLILFSFLLTTSVLQAQYGFFGVQLFTQLIGSWQEGGYEVKATSFNNEPVFIHGIRGGWFLNDNKKFLIGMSGYGASTRINENISLLNSQKLFMLYGTVYLDYNYRLKEKFDINPQFHLGAGLASTSGGVPTNPNLPNEASFYLIEPNINAYFRLGKKVKIGAGVGYRFLTNMTIQGTDNNLLSGPSANVCLKFGPYL